MNLHLFGAATPTGAAFRQLVGASSVHGPVLAYSRSLNNTATLTANFSDPSAFCPGGDFGSPGFWISFGPIWLFAPFLSCLASDFPERLQGLRGVIACSSSSAITKRFAANPFDRDLIARLNGAEEQLLATCRRLQVPCRILQPTLVYGQVGAYGDRNLSRLLQLLRWLPCLPLPSNSGLRQPIHASQLAAVALHLVQQLQNAGLDPELPERIALGGDVNLTYLEMICALQKAQPPRDWARRCKLVPIPNRLFFFLSSPLLLRSPKTFEAVLRMAANLSGFTPAHKLLGVEPLSFPILRQT